MKIKNVLAVMVVALTFPLAKVTLASEPTLIEIGSKYEEEILTGYDNPQGESGLGIYVIKPEKIAGNDLLKYRLVNYKDIEYDAAFEMFGYFCKNPKLAYRYQEKITEIFNRSPKRYNDLISFQAKLRRSEVIVNLTYDYPQCENYKLITR